MKFSVNNVTLIGNIVKDPVMRQVGSENAVMNFSVATSEGWIDKATSEKKEKTQFHNIVIWGKQAKTAEKFLKKGHRVFIEGTIEYRTYEDKEGATKYITEIKATDIMPLFRAEKQSTSGVVSEKKEDSKVAGFDEMAKEVNYEDEDDTIPF